MARGWESKSVEAQKDLSEDDSRRGPKPKLSPEQVETERRRQDLQLSRARVLQQLEEASDPRYKAMLEKALADLDEKLAKLG